MDNRYKNAAELLIESLNEIHTECEDNEQLTQHFLNILNTLMNISINVLRVHHPKVRKEFIKNLTQNVNDIKEQGK